MSSGIKERKKLNRMQQRNCWKQGTPNGKIVLAGKINV